MIFVNFPKKLAKLRFCDKKSNKWGQIVSKKCQID